MALHMTQYLLKLKVNKFHRHIHVVVVVVVVVYIKVFIYSKRQFLLVVVKEKKSFSYLRKFFVAYLSFNKIFTVIWKNFCYLDP